MASARDKPVSPKKRAKTPGGAGHGAKKRVGVSKPREGGAIKTEHAPLLKAEPSADRASRPRNRVPQSTKRSAIKNAGSAIDGSAKAVQAVRSSAKKPRRTSAQRATTKPTIVESAHSGVAAPGQPPELGHLVHDVQEPRGPSQTSTHRQAEAEAARVMELHWGDDVPSSRRSGLVQRWVKRGNALLRNLAEHGAARHEYRADLKDGRFVWVDPDGRVSAEAHAKVLCSWSRSTSALSMAWADPLVREAGISRIEGVPAERDDVDEEAAWRVAMQAADASSADYLYRVNTPHAWYFLGLSKLTFHPERESFTPGTPVSLVRRGLSETVRAVESRAEPAEVVRQRLASLGEALLVESEYAYRGTDWVARLLRTGKRLAALADQLPRPSYGSVAAGRMAGEWLDRQATLDLSDALALLEDEWAAFT